MKNYIHKEKIRCYLVTKGNMYEDIMKLLQGKEVGQERYGYKYFFV
ncbi:hypothetical protein G8S21_05745 [Clostridium botulinum C]|nr:hypothetical protein [Clostridium botulinum]MCD3245448.1 hypothetical protein [Clostridium botulinum C]MCD3261827.1 hypothetical protein [Clostridium botulinum C]